jgi:hypothetical protein
MATKASVATNCFAQVLSWLPTDGFIIYVYIYKYIYIYIYIIYISFIYYKDKTQIYIYNKFVYIKGHSCFHLFSLVHIHGERYMLYTNLTVNTYVYFHTL